MNYMILFRLFFVIALAVSLGNLIELFSFPGSHFFGGVIIGIAVALSTYSKKVKLPKLAFDASLAVTGAVLGAYVTHEAINTVVANLVPIIAISLGTLAISIGAGLLLARLTDISLPTSLLGMLAGGSAMNVVTSDKIEADVRMVTLMHLMRLLLVLIATPILVHFYLAPQSTYHIINTVSTEVQGPFVYSLLTTIVVALVGWFIAVKLPYSGSLILTPLFVAVAFSLYGPGFLPPEGFREIAAILIGLQVGMQFDREILQHAKRYMPIIIVFMMVIIAGCGAFAFFLIKYTPFDRLTSYLATTPGGRTAVVALAFTSGANTTVVLAIQTLRLLVMTLFAPPVISYLVSRKITVSADPEEIVD